MSKDSVAKCEVCCKFRFNKSEPMIVEDFPDCPWQVLGTDFFHLKGHDYLLVADFYSRCIEMALLSSTSSFMVVFIILSQFLLDMSYQKN